MQSCQLTFTNISDQDAADILQHYSSVVGDDRVTFGDNKGFGGMGAKLQGKLEDGTGLLKYRYDGPPQVTSVYPGISTVTCQFIGYLWALRMGSLPPALMSYFSGRNGKLSIKDADAGDGSYREIGRLRNWTVSAATETIDTTCLMDLDKTILPGLRSYSGSATLLYYNTGTNTRHRYLQHHARHVQGRR